MRARSGRRPIPPLIFLLVLALAAAGVWWNVVAGGQERKADEARACATARDGPAVARPDHGLGARAQRHRPGRTAQRSPASCRPGFTVAEIGNDDTGREVTGLGEIRHGPRGKDAAAYVALYLPGASDYPDTRATARSTSSSARSSVADWPPPSRSRPRSHRHERRRRLLKALLQGPAASLRAVGGRGSSGELGRQVGDQRRHPRSERPRSPWGRRRGGRAAR